MKVQLSDLEIEAMRKVADGADVYNYAMAILLRRVERYYPDFITITKARHAPEDGAQEQPYFGAILTAAGKAWIEKRETGEAKS